MALHFVARGKSRVLRRAIAIDEMLRRFVLEDARDRFRIAGLAAEHHRAHGCKSVRHFGGQLIEQRRRQEHRADFLFAQFARKIFWRQRHIARDAHERRAIQQRAPDFERRGVKGRVGNLRHAILAGELNIIRVQHQPVHRAMRHGHAFGRAGRTGRVNDVRQIFRRAACAEDFSGSRAQSIPNRNPNTAQFAGFGIPATNRCCVNSTGVPESASMKVTSLARIRRLNRHIRAARFQNREHSDNHLHRAIQANSHEHIGTDRISLRDNARGDWRDDSIPHT